MLLCRTVRYTPNKMNCCFDTLSLHISCYRPEMIFDPLNQDTFGIGFPPPDSQTNLTSWSSLKGPMWLLEMSFPSEFVIFMYLGSAAKEVKRFKISFLCSDGKTYYSQPSRHAFKIIGSNTKHEWYSWLTWSKSKSWFGPKSHSAMSIGHHGVIHSFSSVCRLVCRCFIKIQGRIS